MSVQLGLGTVKSPRPARSHRWTMTAMVKAGYNIVTLTMTMVRDNDNDNDDDNDNDQPDPPSGHHQRDSPPGKQQPYL